MKVLVLGGTQFVGRHIVTALLAAGHDVTVFNRGRTADPFPAGVQRLRGDRDLGDTGLAALGGQGWDACVDISGYTPRQLFASTARLRGQAERYLFVSAVMSYGNPPQGPVHESQPRQPPAAADVVEVDGTTYGALKVACEDIVTMRFPGRATLLRPQVIVGPHDASRRYTHWVQRAAQGGPMLAPGDGSDMLQMIDVRDVAGFVVRAVEQGLGGAYNLAGPRMGWRDFIELLDVQQPVWVPAARIAAAGLTFLQLPLYRPRGGALASLMHVSAERALAAGLRWTDPAQTLHDVRAAIAGQPFDPMLPAAIEAQLIAATRAT